MKPLPVILGVIALCASIGLISWMSQPRGADSVAATEAKPATSNPLTIAASGPHPKAVLEEEIYDFGKMILGNTDNHSFVIRNDGEAPLVLKKGIVACKCTVPTIPEEAIPPGGTAEIVMEWKPLGPDEAFDKFAEIWTNDPENEKITLKITGEVRQLVQMQPSSPWTISTVREDEPTTITGGIASGQDEFQILEISTTADWLSVEARPLEEDELTRFGEGMASGYMLTATVHPEMPVGRFQEAITIKTDLRLGDGIGYQMPISVSGTRPGPFSILGQEWFGSEMTVRMEKVDPAKGKSVTLSLFTAREDEPMTLTSVETDPDIAEVTLTRDEAFPAKTKERYKLTFTLPAGVPAGRYSDQDRIAVHLTTNRESIPDVNLSIDATVE